MARKRIIAKSWHESMADVPNWPTTMRSNLGDGRLIGVSPSSRDAIGSVWLYKRVPLSPMVDARDDAELERSAAPLAAAFEALGRAATTLGGRRLAEASYRDFHLLSVNVPTRFRPPAGHPLHDILLESFGERTVEQRLVLLGVRLVPALDTSDGLAGAVRGFVESLTSAGVPLVEFSKDHHRLDAELTRAGLVTPKDSDIRLANCWWNLGRYADTPMMPHHNHVHLFGTVEAAVRATRSAPQDCTDWGPGTVPDEWAVTMASVTDLEIDGLSTTDRDARWASLLINMGALCISMRGKVEPAKVTRGVIRRNKELYESDIRERYAAGKSSRGEQESRLAELAQVEDLYANASAPPTIKGLSTIVGFDGNVPDLRDITPPELPLVLAPMSDLQPVAVAELRVSQGLTLIEVGNSHLNLPEPGADADVTQRTALAIVRMLVFGTMSALTGRQGVVFLDEGWVFTSAGKQEMDRLGRLARSLEVFPILLTQKVSDALGAGLAGYISRGLIMHISDVAEARASFELFKLQPTVERMTRVTAKPKMASDTSEEDEKIGAGGAAFDWRSLKALVDSNRKVRRGAVGYHIDLAGRCVPVEITIPDWFVRVASTNGLDIRAREDAARIGAPARMELQPA
jgi:hypothetical protein